PLRCRGGGRHAGQAQRARTRCFDHRLTMDILLIAHGYPPDRRGGTELITAALAGELVRAGHGVRVLAAAEVAGERRVRDATVDGIPVRLLERPVPADYQ